ncbi:MAG: dicarboxylate/amino acid:cation symporter [Lysobacteraceae bacterium]
MSNALKVFLGLLAGALLGMLLATVAPAAGEQAAAIARPIGMLWLNALQMTIVPLVASLLVLGIAQASDAAASGRIARRTLGWILALATASALFTAAFAPFVLSFFDRSPELVTARQAAGGPPAAPTGSVATSIAALVPTNAIAAAAQGAIVPLVVFTLCFGFALTRVAPERRAPVLALAQGIADTMVVIVHGVLKLGPIGVFALILPVTVEAGHRVLGALGVYVLMLVATYSALTAMLYLVGTAAGGERLRRFASAILPAQVVAASTQSSLASLPAMLEVSARGFGYPERIGALVLPLAVALFRITSPAQYLGVLSFVAWAYGIDVPPATLATCIALAVVISLGSVGLPGQASFMGTNLPIIQAAGLPIAPLPLLLAVDLIPDVFATVGNVSAQLTVASRVARAEHATTGRPAPDHPDSPRPTD